MSVKHTQQATTGELTMNFVPSRWRAAIADVIDSMPRRARLIELRLTQSYDTRRKVTRGHLKALYLKGRHNMKALVILTAAIGLSACSSVSGESMTAPSAVVTQQAQAAITQPVQVVAPIAATPVVATAVAPCAVLQAPAAGSSKLLLCVTGDNGSEGVDGAEITYAGQFQGLTNSSGQFMLQLRGYGGTQALVVYQPEYARSPVRVDLALREDHVTETIDLGAGLR